jgi:hypothetical protein
MTGKFLDIIIKERKISEDIEAGEKKRLLIQAFEKSGI